MAFCQHLLEGKSKTQAARDAGYGGAGVALRAAASRAAQSHKVKALIAWARAGGAGLSEVPGDEEELRRILWRHARSADPNRSVRGVEALTKLENAEREAQRASERVHPPEEILAALARKSPATAALCALHEGIFWEVPTADVPRVFEEFAQLRASLEGGQGSVVSQANNGSNGAALASAGANTVSASGLTFDSKTDHCER